jgi:hypothetical protein
MRFSEKIANTGFLFNGLVALRLTHQVSAPVIYGGNQTVALAGCWRELS